MTSNGRILRFGLAAWAVCLAANAPRAALADGWTVFEIGPPAAPNLLSNPGFESGPPGSADGWSAFGQGYGVDAAIAHAGSRSLRLLNSAAADVRGAAQTVVLNQPAPRPLFFSGFSRAAALIGTEGPAYSIYVDILYTDGTPLYGQVLTFGTGTHDWQYKEGAIVPEKPIQSLSIYALLRWEYTGTVWFDDLTLSEFPAGAGPFDRSIVRDATPPAGLGSEPVRTVSSGDGITLGLTATGGAVSSVTLDGASLVPPGREFTGGFLVRDAWAGSDFIHVGGTVAQGSGVLTQTGAVPSLGLGFQATYVARAGFIEISGELSDLTATDRAITLVFAIPLDANGWRFGDELRRSRAVGGLPELRQTTTNGYDEDGPQSRLPWSAVTGVPLAPGFASGLSLAFPLDSPRQCRMAVSPATREFMISFDLGLSARTLHAPSRATFRFVLYRHVSSWPFLDSEGTGLRAATQRYYDIFPAAFTRRAPVASEGIWIAFTPLQGISGLADFGVGYHEGALSDVPFDDGAGVPTLRYVSEPWSYHMAVTDPGVDLADPSQVLAYVQNQYQTGTGAERVLAEATLSSGTFDATGRYRYVSENVPWCNGGGRCVAFILDPDPDVSVAPYSLNKAQTDWNPAVRSAYDTLPTLDGEYIDSFLAYADVANFRAAHAAAVDLALTFGPSAQLLEVPEIFSTYEFARSVAAEVHARGKLMMANGLFLGLPWGADLFDVGGVEVNWLSGASFAAPSDSWFTYKRALASRRPYGTLMNMDFTALTYDRTEQYFRTSLFYGIYPSLFSQDASTNTYWEQPALYNRDRPLFRKYVPLARELSTAGWNPVTFARSSDPGVYLERWGQGPSLRFTARNDTTDLRSPTLSVDAAAVGLPASGALVARDRLGGASRRVVVAGGALSFVWTLPPDGVVVLAFGDGPPPVPDGKTVPGQPLRVARAPAANVTITWDAATCVPPGNHLVWFDLAALPSYTVRATTCAVGASGSWTGAPPSGNVAVLVVSDDGVSVEGSYGSRTAGERPATTAACGMTAKRVGASCP